MNAVDKNAPVGAALVVGGGIGGMQAALDLAEGGIQVYLVETKPSIGGVMAQLDKTFPTNDCAMCTMAPRLVDIGRHKDIEILALADVERISGGPGNFTVAIRKRPRYIIQDRCTGCGLCVSNCPVRNYVQPVPEERREKVVLAPEMEAAVSAILSRWLDKEGPLMPTLQEVHAHFHYFPAPVLRYISQRTGWPLSHLFRIATFYSAFSLVPRGRHTITVCMGTTCYVKGSGRLMEKFSAELGVGVEQTTKDRLFTLKAVRCIGCCGLAPAVSVGQEVFGKLATKRIPAIVEQYRKAG